jgi:molybdopterin-guanine dinucleotide biosynthesis protein B
MTEQSVPVIGVVAPSGSGKTTLLRQLLPLLRERGLRVGYLKHSHHPLAIDRPGKDSFEVAAAGAEQVLLAAADGWALMDYAPQRGADGELALAELLARFDAARLDLVLVEGYRQAHHPKIEVHRSDVGKAPLYPDDPGIIAVATDAALPEDAAPVALPLADPTAIADYIQARLTDGRLRGEDPRDELVRRCREARASPAEPRAGWLSIRVGDHYWLAPIALAGDDATHASIQVRLMTERVEEEESSAADTDGVDLPQAEARIHRHIYAAQPGARAIVGARMPYTAAVGFRGRSFEPVDPDGVAAFRSVPALTLELDELAGKAPKAMAEQLVESGACILAGQGAYTSGRNLSEALQRAALLERSAEIYTLWRQASV